MGGGANVGAGPAAWGRFGVTVPEALKALVQECWAPDFEDRPDFHVVSKVLPLSPWEPPASVRAGPLLVAGRSCVCACSAAAMSTLSCHHQSGHKGALNQTCCLLLSCGIFFNALQQSAR